MVRLLVLLLLMSLSGCTIQQTRVSFGVSVAADYGTTDFALAHGFAEGNPAVATAKLSVAALSSLLTVLIAEWYVHNGDERSASIVYGISSVIHGLAATSNLYVLNNYAKKK